MNKELVITSSPQYHESSTTTSIMWAVTVCLIPAAGWGVYVFGWYSLFVLGVSVLSAVLVEFLAARWLGRGFTIADGSAVLSGLLIGMNMPPEIPWYIPVVASIFAIGVVKWSFGGLGNNWMNPALAGRVFVFFSWTGPMTTWKMPHTLGVVDATSAATPLGAVKAGLAEGAGGATGPVDYLRSLGYPGTAVDSTASSWLNEVLLNPLGIDLPGGYLDAFIGNIPGSIGEVSALLLLLGSVFLVAREIVRWEIPAAYFTVFAVLVWMFGGVQYGAGLFAGDVLFHIFTGGFMLGLFYMSSDMASSPMTSLGLFIYGAGAGFLTFLIRIYGSFPEGVSLAILLMNVFVPLIDRYTKSRRFGVSRRKADA